MVTRYISANASEINKMTADELRESIKASAGRVICSEIIGGMSPIIGDITNAEVATAYGADLILLNGFDCFEPFMFGMPKGTEPKDLIRRLRELTGRSVGVNLEPIPEGVAIMGEKVEISNGRQCNPASLQAASELGFDFICLTGNPGTGVTNEAILNGIIEAKKHFTGLVIAGKMHNAGVDEPVVSMETTKAFVEAGADIILMPAVGTIPGFSEAELAEAVKYAHENDALVMSAIGTSQESADLETIRRIALMNKIAGVDIQHIGDGGYVAGVATLENIYATSVVIRGLRHTMSRISRSARR
ncbi:DUF7916 family protein [Vagococcus zengguangii]|uniref:Haloacid dehalogenase-like hydrolase n=1 Tax=Vagococcus zengguangii TaxID=2571750 RepID=A0A4D7CQ57_9ENTE|nr:haloacid dehalogenase-like hydrolase [Vagococcus zengguangii]QCI86199.1 haloacid dehalogenase-like hydrolase [Vagococcus zengguangii]